MNKSIYIHIPFCKHICYYCNFNKVFFDGQPVDGYIQNLLKEMDMYLDKESIDAVPTIYIGGGTPTSLSAKQLDTLLYGICDRFNMDSVSEFTIEANPGDLPIDKINVLKNYGVNRVSMGVQSFDDELLKKIGRKHTSKDVYHTVDVLKNQGFDNLTIDLMYALPNQSKEMFLDSVNQAKKLQINHISMYALILENRTLFANLERQGKLNLPNEDLEIEIFEAAKQSLAEDGIFQYEICNYSKKGYESQHNLMYWNNEHYFGFGAGASGYLGDIRSKNHGPIKKYMNSIDQNQFPIFDQEHLTVENQMEEHMFLGLRKLSGVTFKSFEEKFHKSIWDVYKPSIYELVDKDYITINNDVIKLTDKGLLFGNDVFASFILD